MCHLTSAGGIYLCEAKVKFNRFGNLARWKRDKVLGVNRAVGLDSMSEFVPNSLRPFRAQLFAFLSLMPHSDL